MRAKLIAAGLATFLVTPAFADYYVVQNATSKKCNVASKKPTGTKVVLVGDGTAYKTKKEARDALAAADACKPQPKT
jgi:hypothetical protein